MKLTTLIIVAGAAIGGLVVWEAFKPEGGTPALVAGLGDRASSAGDAAFTPIPMPDGMSSSGVVIFAPENCPSAAAARARAIAARLAAERIPFRNASQANYSRVSSADEAQRISAVMGGAIPIVYVNGRAKANPSPEDVVAEYRRGRSG